ncbi:hypothetical protein [Parabacteroides sp.]|uniref:hypothetical protein n=1 Tax=Parabacteroides sp. TaxID=1869337 RepID=UPI00308083A4
MKPRTMTTKPQTTETKVFDFTKLEVLNIRNEVETVDYSEYLGNVIYNTTPDLGALDKAREIFHTGKTELTLMEMNYFQSLFQESKAVPAALKITLQDFLKF